jgi:hypothetical protein
MDKEGGFMNLSYTPLHLLTCSQIDIFSKDMVLIPVNHNNAHWTAAAINFRRKRVESYDSMGMVKSIVFSVSFFSSSPSFLHATRIF